jgi:anti-sigma factor RsiW
MDTDILQEYIDDCLEDFEKLILQEHLKNCEMCRRELAQLKVLDWDLRHLPIDIPQEFGRVRQASLHDLEPPTISHQGIKGILALQRQIFAHSASFVHFMPSTKMIRNAQSKVAAYTGRALQERFSRSIWGKFVRI